MKRVFSTHDGVLAVIEGCLRWDDYEALPLKPPLKAAILTGYKLDRFRRDFDDHGRGYHDLVREFRACKSIIIARPDLRMIVYGSEVVTPFSNVWSRLKRGDRTALRALDSAANPVVA